MATATLWQTRRGSSSTVLRGRNREIMDRVLKTLVGGGIGAERLSPTAIVVEHDADLVKLQSDLERDGVFLEGPKANGQRPNGRVNGDPGSDKAPEGPRSGTDKPTELPRS